MPLSNSAHHYGSITRAFHWITALLILTLIPVAVIANELPYDTSEQLARKAWLFSLHKTLGVSVFFVAVLRILWALVQPKPVALHPERRLETFAAETAHWLLYGSLVLAPLSGWMHHAATSGFAPIWWPFGQDLPFIAKSQSTAALFEGLHWVFGKVMVFTLIAHIAGALKHHVIDKDATLRRMVSGTEAGRDIAAETPTKAPIVAAVAVWALMLGVAGGLGLYAPHEETRAEAAALEDVASDWTVQSGDIQITITQFGSEVTGSFADWTAAISYDPTVDTGKSGEVETTISIGSLTLGSVTDQAMGPDFFAADTYPTATFKADLITGIDGFVADGTLTIKDKSMPLKMPFTLLVNGDDAEMQSELTLDRRTFGIGDNMADESSLNFAVDVKIILQATKATE